MVADFETYVRGEEPINPPTPICDVCKDELKPDLEYVKFRKGETAIIRICHVCISQISAIIC